ncbi:MAG: hypothetical protein ACHQNA_00695 [Acidimicrobiales bacterium]
MRSGTAAADAALDVLRDPSLRGIGGSPGAFRPAIPTPRTEESSTTEVVA